VYRYPLAALLINWILEFIPSSNPLECVWKYYSVNRFNLAKTIEELAR
jgi:hypothetical protein